MASLIGSKGNPYTYSDYNMKWQNNSWLGGWVRLENENLVYITNNGSIEQDNVNGYLGSFENPFSLIAYNEMMAAKTWQGGHVLHENVVEYHFSYDEQMNASGSGSVDGSIDGSGSEIGFGSGSGSGSSIVLEANVGLNIGIMSFLLSWTYGDTSTSELSCNSLENNYPDWISCVSVDSLSWQCAYTIHIVVSYISYEVKRTREFDYIIPEIYRG